MAFSWSGAASGVKSQPTSGGKFSWSGSAPVGMAGFQPEVPVFKDVPTLNQALKAGQINQSQWNQQFKQIQAQTAPKQSSGLRTFGSALGGALDKVLVKTPVAVAKSLPQSEKVAATGIARVLPGGTADIQAQKQQATQNNLSANQIIQLQKAGKISKASANNLLQNLSGNAGATTKTLASTLKAMPTKGQLAAGFAGTVADILTAGTLPGLKGTAAGSRLANAGTRAAAFGADAALGTGAAGGTKKQIAESGAIGAALPIVAEGAGKLVGAINKARGSVPHPPSAFDNHIVPTAEELPKAGESTAAAGKTAQNGLKTAGADVERPMLEQPAGTTKNPNIPTINPTNAIPKPSRFKNLISISGELSRQGKSGQEIANRLGKAESTSEIGQAAFLKKVPSVTNLKGKNFSNFVDTLDTLSKNEGKPAEQTILNSLDSKTKQAVDEWSKAIPSVRKQAQDAGVDVGDLGKYYFPKNYTELLSTRQGMAQAAQHLVKTGQAENLGDAVGKLRFMKAEYSQPFGHFERSRTLDLPNYDKSRNALVNYVNGAYNKIGHAEQFGPKGEVANTLIGNIGAEGHDADRALNNYQKAIGQFKYHNPGVDTALSKVRSYQRVTKLGLSSILNATQSVNTAAVAGGARTALAALKQLSKADREYIETTGVRVDSVINALREQAGAASKIAKGANKFQRGLGKILNAPGFGQVERFNRGVAAVAGRDWANSLAAKGSPRALNILRNKLGIEGEIGKVLTPEQQIQAGRKIVELTQFKTGAKDLPQWADSPMGKTVVQFRTFSYKQTGFAYNELIKEAVKGNPLPLMRFIAIGTPVGILAGGARNVLGGKPFYGDTKGQSATKKVLGATYAGSSNVGGTGLAGSALFLAQNRKSPNLPSYIAGDVGGPTVGLGASIVQSYGNKTARERLALGQVPVAGPYLKTKLTPYGSAQTQAFNKAAPEGVAKTLVQLKYQPGDPSDARSTQLKTSDPKKYKQFLNDSNKLFVDAINRAQADPKFNSKNATDKKNTLSHQLSLARQKTLDDMHIPKPKKVKRTKEPSYVR